MRLEKQFKFAVMGVIIVALVALVAVNYDYIFAQGKPPAPNPIDVDTDGDGVPDAKISFSFYQALRIIHTDGTDSWKYPQARTTLLPATIIDLSDQKAVSASQAYMYFNIDSTKQVSSVAFSAFMQIKIYANDKTVFRDLGEQVLSQTIDNPQNAVDIYITSATITANDIGDLLDSYDLAQPKDYYWVISASDISATVTFTDGNIKAFGFTGVQTTENQLWWNFGHLGPDASGIELSIISYGAWSGWT